MSYQEVILEKQNGIATLTLNRPDSLNALGPRLREEVLQALKEVRDDNEIRMLILTAKGRAFCVGADLKQVDSVSSESQRAKMRQQGLQMTDERNTLLMGMGKPVIAAVNGIVLGAGLGIILSCDIRIAAHSATFGAPFAKRSLMADNGITWTLPRLVGRGMAAELLLTGDTVDAQEALRMGLINRVVPDEALIGAALDIAKRIAANAPLSIKYIKEGINAAMTSDLRAALDFEARRMADLFCSEDIQEGIKAFVEKRPPQFKGR